MQILLKKTRKKTTGHSCYKKKNVGKNETKIAWRIEEERRERQNERKRGKERMRERARAR